MTNFEDHGMFYASKKMIYDSLRLSINSGIVYDITKAQDVVMMSLVFASSPIIDEAKQAIKDDDACWYGMATVMTGENNNLIWEY